LTTDQEHVEMDDLWERLLDSLRRLCLSAKLTFRVISPAEVEIATTDGGRSMRLRFQPEDKHSQLSYELEDGTRRDAAILVTNEGRADFRKDGVSQNPDNFGQKLLKELWEERK